MQREEGQDTAAGRQRQADAQRRQPGIHADTPDRANPPQPAIVVGEARELLADEPQNVPAILLFLLSDCVRQDSAAPRLLLFLGDTTDRLSLLAERLAEAGHPPRLCQGPHGSVRSASFEGEGAPVRVLVVRTAPVGMEASHRPGTTALGRVGRSRHPGRMPVPRRLRDSGTTPLRSRRGRWATALITWNLDDFPAGELAACGVRVLDPDAYLCELHGELPQEVSDAVATLAAERRNPPMTAHDAIARLGKAASPQVVRKWCEAFDRSGQQTSPRPLTWGSSMERVTGIEPAL